MDYIAKDGLEKPPIAVKRSCLRGSLSGHFIHTHLSSISCLASSRVGSKDSMYLMVVPSVSFGVFEKLVLMPCCAMLPVVFLTCRYIDQSCHSCTLVLFSAALFSLLESYCGEVVIVFESELAPCASTRSSLAFNRSSSAMTDTSVSRSGRKRLPFCWSS